MLIRQKHEEFKVGEKVLLRVSPTKGIMRFGKKGKLSPKFFGPHEILERIGEVTYRLDLPANLEKVHNVFHISQLRRYIGDPSHVLDPEVIEVDETMTYEETPVKILDSKVRTTRRGEIKMVKVLWNNNNVEEATWEVESLMQQKSPHLFTERGNLF